MGMTRPRPQAILLDRGRGSYVCFWWLYIKGYDRRYDAQIKYILEMWVYGLSLRTPNITLTLPRELTVCLQHVVVHFGAIVCF